MRRTHIAALVPVLAVFGGCVSQGKYDRALQETAKIRSQNSTLAANARAREGAQAAAIARLERDLAEVLKESSLADAHAERLNGNVRECLAGLDVATAINQQLREELERQGGNVDALLAEKGTMAGALNQAKARLEELRRAQAAAEARAALFRDIALRLRRMVDAGELVIALRSGRMVLVLPNDVLFDSGRTKLKPRGQAALDQIAEVLKTLEGRKFQVAGHTDDEPIRFSTFQSNWQLSTERALVVVGYLTKRGMTSSSVSAAGYGEFDPVAANDGPEGRAKNRRIEIVLQPQIDEYVAVPRSP